ncbi:MAG: class I tRNA ligase family protein, partial [Deltaproteobacteria bacterium]|nr:class I tRNA ligase family protein [Deltaproteobacteria bacterium]
PKEENYSVCDRWIKDRLNATVADMVQFLDEYRFNDAAGKIYHFIWHEFCDWYLELIKPVLYGTNSPDGRRAAQHTLVTVLKTILQLLHPIMPFVTEEIWSKLTENEGSIVVSQYPVVDERLSDDEAVEQMNTIIDVISRIRNIRGEMNIPPSKKLKVLLSVPDESHKNVLTSGKDYIVDMANLEKLTIEGEVTEEPKGVATGIAGSTKVFVYLEGTIDIGAEIARLEKEMAKVTKDLAFVSKKLANQDFREKASEMVIEKEILKSKDLKEKNAILENALGRLQSLEG